MKGTSILMIVVIGVAVSCGPMMVKGHPGKVTATIQHTNSEDPDKNGFWQENIEWKPRWVKYWRQKAVYIPLWKKVWGPIIKKEWVPIPKPPPDWETEEEEEDHHEKW